MTLFSRRLSGIAGTFELRPSAEAKEEDVLVAEHAAISRLRQIQDGLDYWEEHWSSVVTGSGGPPPGWARTMFWLSWERLDMKIYQRGSMMAMPRAGMQTRPQGAPSDFAEETLRGLSRVNIYLFRCYPYQISDFVHAMTQFQRFVDAHQRPCFRRYLCLDTCS
jgi:hypothetical protein